MPLMYYNIASLRLNASYASHQAGFGAYSEGTSDDFNKAIWSALYSDTSLSVQDIVNQYTNYFFGSICGPLVATIIFSLEQNWKGDLVTNTNVPYTVQLLQTLQTLVIPEQLLSNWRLQAYLYRGYYDAYVQTRLSFETLLLSNAYTTLAYANINSTVESINAVIAILNSDDTNPARQQLRDQVIKFSGMLQKGITGNVLECQEPNLGLDTIDSRISDVIYLQTTCMALILYYSYFYYFFTIVVKAQNNLSYFV